MQKPKVHKTHRQIGDAAPAKLYHINEILNSVDIIDANSLLSLQRNARIVLTQTKE